MNKKQILKLVKELCDKELFACVGDRDGSPFAYIGGHDAFLDRLAERLEPASVHVLLSDGNQLEDVFFDAPTIEGLGREIHASEPEIEKLLTGETIEIAASRNRKIKLSLQRFTDADNTAIGADSMTATTTGSTSGPWGVSALGLGITGDGSPALGYEALRRNCDCKQPCNAN